MSMVEGGVGTTMPADAEVGSSMRGVTGKESVQSGAHGSAGEIKEGFGNMPVDSENKACELRPWSFSSPT